MYRGRRKNEVPPHLFAISDGAYTEMLTSKSFIVSLFCALFDRFARFGTIAINVEANEGNTSSWQISQFLTLANSISFITSQRMAFMLDSQ